MSHSAADAGSPPFDWRHSSDPHGVAALLLVESLLHTLIRTASLTALDAVDAIETAAEVAVAMVDEAGENATGLIRSVDLLEAMSASLRHDLPATPGA